ncbi:MAG: hypothetical protein RL282_299 [Bacteroidota bacterium]
MSKHLSIISNSLIVLQVFMIFLCFVDLSALPPLIAYIGRLHPLLLHLPITLLLLALPLYLIQNKYPENDVLKNIFSFYLSYTALAATLAALGGLLLASGEEYNANTLFWHKWMGVTTALIAHGLMYLQQARYNKVIWNTALFSGIVTMAIGSHFGGSLTHGEDFLSLDLQQEEEVSFPPLSNKSTVYDAAIHPVLQSKCITCHNSQKKKGGLDLSSFETGFKGGKTGAAWVSEDPDKSILMERMILNMDDKKHMPPKGKAQLSEQEIMLFTEWIKAGGDQKATVQSIPDSILLKNLVMSVRAAYSTEKKAKTYDFKAADAKTIQSLNNPFRRILPLANNSPALSVKFYLKEQFSANALKECQSIREQVIEINLSGMPADDNIIPILNEFENLEKLNLNETAITGKNLSALKANKKLVQLSVAGTQVDSKSLASLSSLPSLKQVYLWNTKVGPEEAAKLNTSYASIKWDIGFIPDKAERLKLTAPYPVNRDKTILEPGEKIALKHPLPGVKIKYTLDGTAPDSVNGIFYSTPITPEKVTRVISMSVADGWLNSGTTDYTFFAKGIAPDSATLLTLPEPKYRKIGAAGLIDLSKGETGNLGLYWLGFRENQMKAGFHFSNAPMIKEVMLSIAQNTQSYVFPPTMIIIKGGSNSTDAKIIGTFKPTLPDKHLPNATLPFSIAVKEGNYKYIEIEAKNIQKLPKWHNGKGEKAWVFVDEVFFY